MIISELLDQIKNNPDYVINSLYLKSSDNYGCTYKWLTNGSNLATRKQIFIATDIEESELELVNKTVIKWVEVYPAV